jgi:hypothetical protein
MLGKDVSLTPISINEEALKKREYNGKEKDRNGSSSNS